MTDSLNCVCVERNMTAVSNLGKLLYGFDRADFIVGHHDGYEYRIIRNGAEKVIWIYTAF